MAYKCDNCGKGKVAGHMVSHAKNRLARLFLPNLQKLKVLQNGVVIRVKFCTSCIKRMRKYGHIGAFSVLKLAPIKAVTPGETIKTVIAKVEKVTRVKKEKEAKAKVEKAKETLDIASIVGKKS